MDPDPKFSGSHLDLKPNGTNRQKFGLYKKTFPWWLIGSAPDYLGSGPGFKSGISHKEPYVKQDHC